MLSVLNEFFEAKNPSPSDGRNDRQPEMDSRQPISMPQRIAQKVTDATGVRNGFRVPGTNSFRCLCLLHVIMWSEFQITQRTRLFAKHIGNGRDRHLMTLGRLLTSHFDSTSQRGFFFRNLL